MNEKICYQGDGTPETGKRIIQALKKLPGVRNNNYYYDGSSTNFYYVDSQKYINITTVIPQGYKLISLDDNDIKVGDIIKIKYGSPYKVIDEKSFRKQAFESSRNFQVYKVKDNLVYFEREDYKGQMFYIVEKQNVITNKIKNRTLTPKDATKIINIACAEWRNKLAVLWAKDIVLGKDIEVSEEFYQKMRTACTAPQNELFDEIFGKDDGLIKAIDLKEGECILSKDDHQDALILRTALGFVDLNELGWGVKDINPLCKGIKVKLNITYEQI